MEILRNILESIDGDAPVTEVSRGLHWTAVVSRRCGLASTLPADSCNKEIDGETEGFLTDMMALEIARRCLSDDISQASLGIAAINSLVDVDVDVCSDMDGLKMAHNMGRGKNISVIGHFPFLENLAKIARNFWIIEKRPRPGDFPEENKDEYLPQSDIVVISSTTLINHTLPGILSLCRKGSLKILLGPTTPMMPVLFDHGIDILSGSVVTDKVALLKHVREGANFMRIKKSGSVRFVTMVKDKKMLIE